MKNQVDFRHTAYFHAVSNKIYKIHSIQQITDCFLQQSLQWHFVEKNVTRGPHIKKKNCPQVPVIQVLRLCVCVCVCVRARAYEFEQIRVCATLVKNSLRYNLQDAPCFSFSPSLKCSHAKLWERRHFNTSYSEWKWATHSCHCRFRHEFTSKSRYR